MHPETPHPLATAGPDRSDPSHRSDRFPFDPFPRSWYLVAWSDELAPGAVLPLAYFGRELVLFRTAEAKGRPVVLDAYCPHLGAHLGHGGVVCGETLQCPFHGWRFDAAGQCVLVPHASRIPPLAETRAWPVHETSGMILVYYDPEGAAPGWAVPEIPEMGGTRPGDRPVEGWLPVERRRWRVRTHVKDTNENNCDRAHLLFMHGLEAVDSSAETDGHVMRVRHAFKAEMSRIGMPGTVFDGVVEGTHTGLGVLQQRIRSLVEGLLVSTQTPIDGESVDLRFAFTVKTAPSEDIAKVAMTAMWGDLVRDVEDDIRIWERKAYLSRPVLSEADGPIGLYRKWSRQF
jgi:3-ketosteroid 9alpha-monooxygenase subunit A